MSERCTRIQEEMLDAFEETFILTEEVKKHMETCSECRTYYDKLFAMNHELSFDIDAIPINYESIDAAIEEGYKQTKARVLLWNNVGFFLLSVIIFTAIGVIISLGYSYVVLILQVIIVAFSPIIIPLVIRRQLQGGA